MNFGSWKKRTPNDFAGGNTLGKFNTVVVTELWLIICSQLIVIVTDNQYLLEMASLIDLERLQNEKQMSNPVPQQIKTYLSPSLTP